MFLINKHYTITTYTPFRMWYFLPLISSLSFFNGTYFKTLGKTVMALCLPFLKQDMLVQQILQNNIKYQIDVRVFMRWYYGGRSREEKYLSLADGGSPEDHDNALEELLMLCEIVNTNAWKNQELVLMYHPIAYFLAVVTIIILHVVIHVIYLMQIRRTLLPLDINGVDTCIVALNILVLGLRLLYMYGSYTFFNYNKVVLVFSLVDLDSNAKKQLDERVLKICDIITYPLEVIMIGYKLNSYGGGYVLDITYPSPEKFPVRFYEAVICLIGKIVKPRIVYMGIASQLSSEYTRTDLKLVTKSLRH